MDNDKARRIILFGEVGKGKSSTGNTLLKRNVFEADDTMDSVTKTCEVKGNISSDNTKYIVMDTPGLYDADGNVAEQALKIQKGMEELCPNPHVFLLVFDKSRFTEHNRSTAYMMKTIFGLDVLKYTLIVFTHGNEFSSEKNFEKYWMSSKEFTSIANEAENRVFRIENMPHPTDEDEWGHFEDHPLYAAMSQLSDNWTKVYKPQYIDVHREILEELRNTKGEQNKEKMILSLCCEKVGKTKANKKILRVQQECEEKVQKKARTHEVEIMAMQLEHQTKLKRMKNKLQKKESKTPMVQAVGCAAATAVGAIGGGAKVAIGVGTVLCICKFIEFLRRDKEKTN